MKTSTLTVSTASCPKSTLCSTADSSIPGIFTGYGFFIVGIPFLAGYAALLYSFL